MGNSDTGYKPTRSETSRFQDMVTGSAKLKLAAGRFAKISKMAASEGRQFPNNAALGRMAPILPHSSAFLCLGDVGLGPPIV
jgi:hypothetical protein